MAVKSVDTKDSSKTLAKKKTKKYRFWNKKGVVYVRHIPHGFFEDQMRSYFSQFGKVLTVKVSRSFKTGRSRGYGYVQFLHEDVAKVAAESMNNYLMYEKIVQCRLLPPDEVKMSMVRESSMRPGVKCPGMLRQEDSIRQLSAHKTQKQMNTSRRRRERTMSKTLHRLSSLGIGFKY